jgi:hypothetical protein
LAQAIGRQHAGRSAVLGGEIVHPGSDGRPMFYELMRPRAVLLLRTRSAVAGRQRSARSDAVRAEVAAAETAAAEGADGGTWCTSPGAPTCFRAICEQDMEGAVPSGERAAPARGDDLVKIKNRQ